jgi:hypothetical protein
VHVLHDMAGLQPQSLQSLRLSKLERKRLVGAVEGARRQLANAAAAAKRAFDPAVVHADVVRFLEPHQVRYSTDTQLVLD